MSNYITIADADTYFSTKLNTTPWDNATDANKTKALTMATDAIDRINFIGSMTDEDQDNQFPRGGDTTVPTDIQYACAEEALALLDGKNPEMEYENLRLESQEYAKTKSKYRDYPHNIIAGIMSAKAWRYLLPYIRDDQEVTISRFS